MPSLAPLSMSVAASDGVILRGELRYPSGPLGTQFPLAVLAHQYPSTHASFAPLLDDLHSLGIATLAFDLRGHGASIWATAGMRVVDTPVLPTMEAFGEAFMSSAAKTGFAHISDDIVRVASWGMAQNYVDASRVLLVGASVGGTGVLLGAPAIGPGLRGVVTFAAAGAPAHGSDANARIRQTCETLTVPMLLTSAERDAFDGARNARTWADGLSHVRAVVVPGDAHAMGIYHAVRAGVVQFVRRTMMANASGARRKYSVRSVSGRNRRRR